MAEHFCTRARVIATVANEQCHKPTKRLPACNGCNVWQDVQIGQETNVNIEGRDTKVTLYGPILNSSPVPVFQY